MEKNIEVYREFLSEIDPLLQYVNLSEESKVLNMNRLTNYLELLKEDIGCEVVLYDNGEDDRFNEKVFNEKYDTIFNISIISRFESKGQFVELIQKFKNSITEFGLIVLEMDNPDCEDYIKGIESEFENEGVKALTNVKRKGDLMEYSLKVESEGAILIDKKDEYPVISLNDIEQILEENEMYLLDVFSDYKLHKFNKETSERMILIFK
ncbi:hypothetical protein AB4865_10165 [Capnocytophaga sp. ARDL2]|uniref:hypothetical protein n=1 Tax=Capnocytophaga sp. ARDL2 TaxID=3238809 RepID=UPI00355721DD